MTSRITILLGALFLIAALALGCGDDDDGGSASPTPMVSGTSTVSQTDSQGATTAPPAQIPSQTGAPSPAAVNVCVSPPGMPAIPSIVTVTLPQPADQVMSPLTVTGNVAAFEATFEVAIKDANNNDIATLTGHAQQGQTLSPFSESVPFSVSAQTDACVWVYQISAADGLPTRVYQIPVVLLP